jgi:hypothetical protein
VAVGPKKRNNTSEMKTRSILELVSGISNKDSLWRPIIDKN